MIYRGDTKEIRKSKMHLDNAQKMHKMIYKTLDKYLVNDKMNIRMSKSIS